jgi:hypothetical protein
MRSINVNRLIQRECNIAADNCAVDSAVKVRNTRLRETRDKLLDITNSLGSASWLARSTTIPELQVLNNGMSCYRRASVLHGEFDVQ